MEIKDMSNTYIVDGKVNAEALKKDYPEEFVNEIMQEMSIEESLAMLGIDRPAGVNKAVVDDYNTLVMMITTL